MVKIRKIHKTKVSKPFLLIFGILWILIAFNTNSADAEYYQTLYERIASGETAFAVEYGFVFLMQLAIFLKLSFKCFLCLYTFIGLSLTASTILKFCKKPSIVLLLYSLYPFLLDVAQIRQFMIMSIFVFSVRYLIKFNKGNILKYLLCIFIASTQQITAFAFIVFLLVYFINDKNTVKFTLLGCVSTAFFGKLVFSSTLFKTIASIRANHEIDYSLGMKGESQFLMYCTFFLMLVFIQYLVYHKFSNKTESDALLYKISMLSTIFIPFMLYDFQYSRLFRASIIIIYLSIFGNINRLRANSGNVFIFIVVIMLISVSIKLFGPSSGYYITLTKPIFEDNMLFSLIF